MDAGAPAKYNQVLAAVILYLRAWKTYCVMATK